VWAPSKQRISERRQAHKAANPGVLVYRGGYKSPRRAAV
jgi:hypothetical protein